MARSSRRFGSKMPGVSMNTSWLLPAMAMPRIGIRVVCTLWLTIETLAPTMRVDQRRLAGVGRADHGDEAAAPRAVRPAACFLRSVTHAAAPSIHFARQEGGGGGLLGRSLRAALAARRLVARDRAPRDRTSARGRAPCARPRYIAAAAGLGPAPTPAAPTSDRRDIAAGHRAAVHHSWRTISRAASKPASMNTAPSTASMASARIVSLSRPPCRPRCRSGPGWRRGRCWRRPARRCSPRTSRLKRARQLALRWHPETLAHQLGDGQTQHPVAEEFEPLVVGPRLRAGARAGVRQRPCQQAHGP